MATLIELDGNNSQVEVTSDGGSVGLRFSDGETSVTLVGTKRDVHQLIIEADRQLGHLPTRSPTGSHR